MCELTPVAEQTALARQRVCRSHGDVAAAFALFALGFDRGIEQPKRALVFARRGEHLTQRRAHLCRESLVAKLHRQLERGVAMPGGFACQALGIADVTEPILS